MGSASLPKACSRSIVAGAARMRLTSLLSRLTMGSARPARCDQTLPAGDVETRDTGLRQGRHVGQGEIALRARYRERAQPTAPDELHHGGRRVHHENRAGPDELGHGRRAAAERDVLHLDPGFQREQLDGEMRAGAGVGSRAERQPDGKRNTLAVRRRSTIRSTRVIGVVRRWIAALTSRRLRASQPELVSFPADPVESAGGAMPPPPGRHKRGKGGGGKAGDREPRRPIPGEGSDAIDVV